MTNIIKIKYDHDSKETEIICNEQIFDTSCIKDTEISMWVYPFVRNGFRWNGIYSEMVTFTGSEDFKINFYGSDEDMEILKTALQSKNITVAGLNNKVIILYNRDNLSTKITINGKIFDTSRIQNRSIEEWINPITFSGINWQGIFKEIEDFLGIDSYSIQFSGNPDDMALLMDNSDGKIDIQYKQPIKKSLSSVQSRSASKQNMGNSTATHNSNYTDNVQFSGNIQNVVNQLKTGGSDTPDTSNIPIKNDFIRNNILTICASISILSCIFPFVFYGDNDIKLSVFDIISEKCADNSMVYVLLIIIPIILIVMNYITSLKSYRRTLSAVVPAISAILEIYLFYSWASDDNYVKLAYGAVIMFISYIATIFFGFMLYRGVKLPFNKDHNYY